MSAMGEMPMLGQTQLGTAAAFLGMWTLMMAAMMLPSLLPMLWRYRLAVDSSGGSRLGPLIVTVGAAYFFVWTAFGMVAFPLSVALATPALRNPIGVGAVVLLVGAVQLTEWRAHHLASCRKEPAPARVLPANIGTAWRHGMRLGLHCVYSCAGLTTLLLVVGGMDLRAMAIVTAAITVERLAPASERVARVIGGAVVCAGLFLIARAAGLG